MSIYCSDLFSLTTFQNVKLRAGEDGLTRKVTWPFVCVTPTISQWLHGGELLFVTGLGLSISDTYLINLTTECISKNLSGIIFLLHPEHIAFIPNEVLRLANEKSFPLFEMPWDVKLVDATREIIQLIQAEHNFQERTRFFLESALFSENCDIDSLLQFYDIALYSNYCLGIVQANETSFSKTTELCFRQMNSFVRHKRFETDTSTILSFSYANQLILLITADQNFDDVRKEIEKAFRHVKTLFPSHPIYLAFSAVKQEISEIKAAYKEVQLCLSYKDYHLLPSPECIIRYEQLGIYRILLELKKNGSIVDYCYKNIEVLIDYDQKHSSNLLKTLKSYFINNNSLTKTAADLYIHKNTLSYRLSLIKTLLETDFSNSLEQMELFISVLLYDT